MDRCLGMESQERARRQTVDEWLAERFPDSPIDHIDEPTSLVSQPISFLTKTEILRALVYHSHRTTKDGCVVLSFVDPDTSEEFVAFFGVDIRIQRGPDQGKSYRAGLGGQFLPMDRSNFRKFWLEVVGYPPRRWAASHKELKARFRGKLFTGDVKVCLDRHGKPYNKLVNPRKLTEQEGNKYGTKKEQVGNNNWEQEIPW